MFRALRTLCCAVVGLVLVALWVVCVCVHSYPPGTTISEGILATLSVPLTAAVIARFARPAPLALFIYGSLGEAICVAGYLSGLPLALELEYGRLTVVGVVTLAGMAICAVGTLCWKIGDSIERETDRP
jgi:hypothetical protein